MTTESVFYTYGKVGVGVKFYVANNSIEGASPKEAFFSGIQS